MRVLSSKTTGIRLANAVMYSKRLCKSLTFVITHVMCFIDLNPCEINYRSA